MRSFEEDRLLGSYEKLTPKEASALQEFRKHVSKVSIGFTGTSKQALTTTQIMHLDEWFNSTTILHHGDCINADATAHEIAIASSSSVIIHPPIVSAKRAFCKGAIRVAEPLDYITRNRVIVIETSRLIACPALEHEELRSGTWATVRFARKLKRPILILYPSGRIQREN